MLNPRLPNFAREVLFRTSLNKTTPAHFVSNNCISGLVAINSAYEGILSGRIKSAIAGGVESMSNPTLTLSEKAEQFFIKLNAAKTTAQKLSVLLNFRPSFIIPNAPSPKEPSTGKTMGQHCELMVKEFGISRSEQDEIAYKSHNNASKAQSEGFFDSEVFTVNGISKDNIVRADTSIEKLSKLKPVFDRSEKGTITAGNSSPLTDGASAVFLCEEEFAKEKGYKILGFIKSIEFSALDPKLGLLMAPAVAIPNILKRNNLKLSDIDIFEIHEAFGGQVACNLKALEKGWSAINSESIGEIPRDKINKNGGSIALGHPFAATGGRLILSALSLLEREDKKTALISVCAAGGMAGAVIMERRAPARLPESP